MPIAKPRSSIDILIQCPGSHGVVPDHVHEQATALHDLGLKIVVLCCPAFTRSRVAAYPTIPCMSEGATTNRANAFSRKVGKAIQTVRNQLIFALEVYKQRPAIVLTASHVDSQSPVWIWPHLMMVLFRKTIYAMNLHFSQRDHHLGPKWWQKLGAALSYKPFRIAVAHKRLPAPSPLPRHIRTVEVPIGPEKTAQIRENPRLIRRKWNVPRGKKVFLAFGHVRNHKNLDLVIRALLDNPQAFLVILGRVSNHRDRPLKYYQMLADDLGLSKRVLISDEFVPDEKRQSYFEAADFVITTYSSGFHSQTATLSTAAKARRHVLASCGPGPMRDLVEHFGLGVFVEPDSSEAVADGMATLLNGELPKSNWEGFEDHATWETNVTRLLEAAADYVGGRPTPLRQFEGLADEAVPVPKLISAKSLLPAKATRAAKPKKAAPSKAKPVRRKKPAPIAESKSVSPVPLPLPIAEGETLPLFPALEPLSTTPHPKVNGVNGHSTSKEIAPTPEKAASSRARKPAVKRRSRISPLDPAEEPAVAKAAAI